MKNPWLIGDILAECSPQALHRRCTDLGIDPAHGELLAQVARAYPEDTREHGSHRRYMMALAAPPGVRHALLEQCQSLPWKTFRSRLRSAARA